MTSPSSPVKLVLASRSVTRIAMLQAAGIPIEIDPADVDEDTIGAPFVDAGDRAAALAREKALFVSKRHPGRFVLGGDQVCTLDGAFVEKPRDAEDHLRMLLAQSGRTHVFFPAAALVKDGVVLDEKREKVSVTFRAFSKETALAYIASGEGAGSCGGYECEHLGAQLIERIEGTQFALMGLPLLGVLEALRVHGFPGML